MDLKLWQGRVSKVERKRANDNGPDWILFHSPSCPQPLALRDGFNLPYPVEGDTISIEIADHGFAWDFGIHKSLAVTPSTQHYFNIEGIETWQGKAGLLAEPVLMWLWTHNQIGGDDVYDAIRRLAPENDPRIVALPFMFLSRKGIIHKVGDRPSRRPEDHHGPLSVWELSEKYRLQKLGWKQ